MTRRYFTPGEVDALIPELARIMGKVMKAHEAVAALTGEREAERTRIVMVGGGLIDRHAWRRATARLARRTQEIEGGVRTIEDLGGTPKDLGLGLVDFPHWLNDREVNLCWRHGESEVRFWHGLDEGYGGRRPL